MTLTAALLIASTCLYTGFQWTIRVLVYPQFAAVPAAGFVAYERSHQRLVSIAVAPLFLFLGGTAIAAFAARPALTTAAAGACCAGILLTTALGAVPQHRRLSDGFDAGVLSRLLRIDAVRLGLAVLACGFAGLNAAG